MDKGKFERLINRKSQMRLNSIIPNSSVDNGASALIKMFNLAEHSIKLLVGDLDSPIPQTEGYKEALEDAIKKREVSLQIVFTKPPNTNSEIFKFLLALKAGHYSRKVNLREISSKGITELNNEIDNDGSPFFFAVSDALMYRFEKDVINHTAWVNYNDSARSERLAEVFDLVYLLSEEIEEKHSALC